MTEEMKNEEVEGMGAGDPAELEELIQKFGLVSQKDMEHAAEIEKAE